MLINVMLCGETYWENGVPGVRGGYPGQMDTKVLEHKETVLDNENEHTVATEYWLAGQLVHRSVHVHLKKGLVMDGFQAKFG